LGYHQGALDPNRLRNVNGPWVERRGVDLKKKKFFGLVRTFDEVGESGWGRHKV